MSPPKYRQYDLEIGSKVIYWLRWFPTRTMFRSKFISLAGNWEHNWAGEVGRFENPIARHGNHKIYQFLRWVYAETRSQGKIFCVVGRIQGDYLSGRWYDKHDDSGYFGAFHMRIVDSQTMNGEWIGHSKSNPAVVGSGQWLWNKNPD